MRGRCGCLSSHSSSILFSCAELVVARKREEGRLWTAAAEQFGSKVFSEPQNMCRPRRARLRVGMPRRERQKGGRGGKGHHITYESGGSPSPCVPQCSVFVRFILRLGSNRAFSGRIGEPWGDPGRSAAFSDMVTKRVSNDLPSFFLTLEVGQG